MSKAYEGDWSYRQAYSKGEPVGFVVQNGTANPICDVETEELARLITAAPALYAACNSADVLCAVLNISDITPQLRSCGREAWPLVQEALAKVKPSSNFAAAIKDAHQHEIKRLDGIIQEKDAEIERLRAELQKEQNAYRGPMDPGCYYAKSCGHEVGTCPGCKERRQTPADGIYYGDEVGQTAPEERED